jgi:zinc transporter ZupT
MSERTLERLLMALVALAAGSLLRGTFFHKPRSALAYNLASALTFLVGGLVAYPISGTLDVAFLVPFAAGNFVYIAAADLVPQITSPVAW